MAAHRHWIFQTADMLIKIRELSSYTHNAPWMLFLQCRCLLNSFLKTVEASRVCYPIEYLKSCVQALDWETAPEATMEWKTSMLFSS